MAYCRYCGAKLEDGTAFCPNCGAKIDAEKTESKGKTDFSDDLKKLTDTPDTTANYDPHDISDNKVMAILCYIGILWLIPFLTTKESPFVKYHLNQGLTLLILALVVAAVSWIPVVGWLCSVVVFALAILGIVNVVNGKAQELPVIGKFTLLK